MSGRRVLAGRRVGSDRDGMELAVLWRAARVASTRATHIALRSLAARRPQP